MIRNMKHLLTGCTFTELAMAYLPHDTPRAARRTLHHWIRVHPTLNATLTRCGLRIKGQKGRLKRLTPQQVRLIFNALGEP